VEPVDEQLDVLVQDRMCGELCTTPSSVTRSQLALDDQIGDLEEGALLRQLLDGIAAVAQDALLAVDEVIALRHDAVLVNAGS